MVFFGGWRVNGTLAVSRAIGDFEQKPYVSGEPGIEQYEFEGTWNCFEINEAAGSWQILGFPGNKKIDKVSNKVLAQDW